MVERVRIKGMQDKKLVARPDGAGTRNGQAEASSHRTFPSIIRSTVEHKFAISTGNLGDLTPEQHAAALATDRDEVRAFYTVPNPYHDMPTTFEEITDGHVELKKKIAEQDAADARLMREGVPVILNGADYDRQAELGDVPPRTRVILDPENRLYNFGWRDTKGRMHNKP